MIRRRQCACCVLILCISVSATAIASEPSDAESAIRRMVRANAEKDLPTLSRLMAHDADIISYAVAGRKYIGWTELEEGMREEFVNSQKLEIPINELKVWTKGDLAWYTMELDYIRYVADGPELKRTVLPMRETGVLERVGRDQRRTRRRGGFVRGERRVGSGELSAAVVVLCHGSPSSGTSVPTC